MNLGELSGARLLGILLLVAVVGSVVMAKKRI